MKKKIKILFAIDRMSIGGAPTLVYHQLRFIDKNRFEPFLVTLYPSKKANYLGRINFLDESHQLHLRLRNRKLYDFPTWWRLFRFIRRNNIDIVYTHLFITNVIVRAVAVLTGVKKIFSFEHSFYYHKNSWQVIVDKILSWWTDKIITPNEGIADFTSRQEGIPREKFFVNPYPVVLPNEKEINTTALRGEFSIPHNSPVVLTLGRFSPEKGQKYFIRMAEMLHKKMPDIHFILVGHGPLELALKEQIAASSARDAVQLIAEPLRAKEFYYTADVFVSTSLREGLPIVILEALTAQLPVAGFAIDGLESIITSGEEGVLVTPKNISALADAIETILTNANLKTEMIKKGVARARGYTPEVNIEKFESLIKRTLY